MDSTPPPTASRHLLSGAAAGAGSSLAFMFLHQLLISDIWFSLGFMLAAGAVSGICLAWTYGLLFAASTAEGWWLYNGFLVALLVLLGLTSLVVYEPVTTMAAVMADGGAPPSDLLREAMPLTVGFVLGPTAMLSFLWGRSLLEACSVLVTTTVIIALLGINVSALGLVELDGSAARMLVMMVGLTMALLFGFAGIVHLLDRRRFVGDPATPLPHRTASGPSPPDRSPQSRSA